jgi:catechol 2,3-dioxygenase-like lactoylglutathione lyase family enzyme
MSASTVIKFHLALSVSDVSRSARFYESLFGLAPTRLETDYARFELCDPPLVLSLIPGAVVPGGALNHLGLRMPDCESLVGVQYRLEAAGIATRREEHVSCCYSRQTKFWVTDPDRTLWEIYVLEPQDAGNECDGHATARPGIAVTETNGVAGGSETWCHWLGQPIPPAIPHPDDSLDEVRLEGTFNQQLSPGSMGQLLAEVQRVLKPGSLLRVHGLVADKSLTRGKPSLPGPAALVERVPLAAEPASCLSAAGFTNVSLEPQRSQPDFIVDGIALRELKLTAVAPSRGR